jgi:carbonic anhydrase
MEVTMHRRSALEILAGLALCPLCARTPFAGESHWSYEGQTGPDNWGALDAASKICSTGNQESPVDITDAIDAPQAPLVVSWTKRPDTIVNNAHTIQLNFTAGNTLTVGSRRYGLVQFHFHHPSEHLLHGGRFAMEAHFVHADGNNLAVVGVFLTPGGSNPAFNRIVSTMPVTEGPPVPADPAIDPNDLLPRQQGYYRYEGSLTTPPCSETVDWLVISEPEEVAQTDIERFAKLYPMNARPVQPRNRRFILRASG